MPWFSNLEVREPSLHLPEQIKGVSQLPSSQIGLHEHLSALKIIKRIFPDTARMLLTILPSYPMLNASRDPPSHGFFSMLVYYSFEIHALAFVAAVLNVSFVPQNQIIMHLVTKSQGRSFTG